MLWTEKLGFLSTVPLPLAPDVLAYNAQQLLGKLGYTTPPADSAWDLNCCDHSNEEALKKMDPARRKAVLASHQPPVVQFWYRQDLQPFPTNGDAAYGRPTETTPPNSEPGMILIQLDATGRLLRLQVQPWLEQPAQPEVNWANLFEAAGLGFSRFSPVSPTGIPPMAVDAQLAWQGPYPNRIEPVTIHAASWRGRPVLFEAQEPASSSPPRPFTPYVLPAVLGMGILAWRNWRAGRWDRRGATILTVIIFGFALAGGLGTRAPMIALAGWILYVGIEPLARRYWPDSLISWTRVCQGQWNSPLVASHILAGILPATLVSYLVLNGVLGLYSPLPVTTASQGAFSDFSPWIKLTQGIAAGTLFALVFLTFAILVRLAIRKLWIADLLTAILFNVPAFAGTFLGSADQRVVLAGMMILPSVVWVVLMRRLGFLTFLTVWVTFIPIYTTPPPMVTGWMVRDTLPIHLLPVAVGAWALWVILSAQRSPSTESQS